MGAEDPNGWGSCCSMQTGSMRPIYRDIEDDLPETRTGPILSQQVVMHCLNCLVGQLKGVP